MRIKMPWHAAALLLLTLLSITAISNSNATAARVAAVRVKPNAAMPQASVEALRPVDLATKGQVDALQKSLLKVSLAVDTLASKGTDYVPPVFGVLGVIVGGLVTFLSTWRIAKSREALDIGIATSKAELDIAKSVIDWKLKQLSELYGPLRTLFAQSNAVYRTMNVVLQNADGTKFKLLEPKDLELPEFSHFKKELDYDGKLFVLKREPELSWERFRTVLYIDQVYGKTYQVELYFDTILNIAGRVVDVIVTKAGLALSEKSDVTAGGGGDVKLEDTLRHKFGQYLAHAAVLSAVHANRRSVYRKRMGEVVEKELLALDLATHKSAAFPQDIQKLVGESYMALQKDVADWGKLEIKH